MSIPTAAEGPAPRQVPNTLLATLQAFTRAQETRRSLSLELESALSSFLTSTPTPLANPTDALSNLATPSGSTCATEAVRPPNEAELGEVLRIGFLGLMEIRDEVEELEAVLRMAWKREDLADVLKKVEGLEAERLKETIRRDQLRRLATLTPDQDFTDAIKVHEKRRAELAQEIGEESQEISAELADLSAAEE
ncbi:hypothetical protein BCR35DRAFT_320073 [Leucosporidium creatinivorum]|uniref:Uncharacterized protein n=1 Tax=Leucosporidium creatinivorum TaxID=106004 RepID=A0A1Y2G4M9_9BASI|nr:hypothetical protein BCR35DRAFT_320073 [Leucosporidium creatinivorum]